MARVLVCARALAAALLLAGSTAEICFEEWTCIFHYLDASKTTEFSYDLRPLCTGVDRKYGLVTPEGYVWNITYSICGNTSYSCNPYWPHFAAHGNVIMQWGLPPAGKTTTDPETKKTVPATADCEVLGHTRPEFDLFDDNNPATGGIVLKHSSLPPASTDVYKCPTNPLTGYPTERQVNIVLLCDPTLSTTALVPVGFNEVKPGALGTCIYNFTLRTGAACGSVGDPFDPACSTGPSAAAVEQQLQVGRPSVNFGYTVLGVVLCALVQMAIARGLFEPVSAALQRAGFGFGKGGLPHISTSSPTAFSTSSASTSSPMSARSGYGAI